jgi:head-tail adaptor
MSYDDQLRDRVTIQQRTNTADGGFGQTTTWDDLRSIPARVTTVSGRELKAYQRDGYEKVMRVVCDDAIRRTNGTNSLQAIIEDPTQAHYRIMYRGRTLNPVAVVRPLEGVHDTAAHHVFIDCIETPIKVGQMDA